MPFNKTKILNREISLEYEKKDEKKIIDSINLISSYIKITLIWFIKSLEVHKKSKLKRDIQKLLLIVSLITVGIRYPAKIISQPLS